MQALAGAAQRQWSSALLFFILLLLLAGPACVRAQVTLDGSESYVRISPGQFSYRTGSSADDAATLLDAQDGWTDSRSLLLDPPVSDKPVWVRIQIHNSTPHPLKRLLEIQWVNLDDIRLFQRNSTGQLTRVSNGLRMDQSGIYRPAASFLLPLTLPPDQTSTLLLRIETSHLLMLPLYVWEEESFGRYELNYYTLYGLLFGAMLVMFFYNLVLWLLVRDGSYLLYCLYLAFTVLYLLAATGIGKHSLWTDYDWLRPHAYPLFAACAFFTAAVFITTFLHLRARARWMYGFGWLAAVYWTVEIVANLLSHQLPATATNAAAMITSLGALTITLTLSFRGDRIAITFAIAWAFLISSTIIMLLMLHGSLPQNFVTQHIQSAGFLLETILISIALAQRINRERELKERAQKALLTLRDKSNRDLEDRVLQRTMELQKLTNRLSHSNNELQRLSITDALTGLHNRRYFDEVLKREIVRSYNNRQPLALILSDIDHFKTFNDTWGHVAGDDCLQAVAEELQASIRRDVDCVARYGGEEFAIILPGMSLEDASLRAEEIRRSIAARSLRIRGSEVQITMSFGVTAVVADNETLASHITDQADLALYEAKRSGRNLVVLYNRQLRDPRKTKSDKPAD